MNHACINPAPSFSIKKPMLTLMFDFQCKIAVETYMPDIFDMLAAQLVSSPVAQIQVILKD
jgi:hypothetical protein